MLQFLPPIGSALKSISVAVHGGGLGKCNIAGVRAMPMLHFYLPPKTPIFLGGYKHEIMYVTFFTPWGGVRGAKRVAISAIKTRRRMARERRGAGLIC